MGKTGPNQGSKQFPWRTIIKWLLVALLAAIVMLMIFIVRGEQGYRRGNTTYDDILRKVVTTPENTSGDLPWNPQSNLLPTPALQTQAAVQLTSIPTESHQPTPFLDYAMDRARVQSLVNVDFTQLQSMNSDVEAWLFGEQSPISYPLVHGENNERYLKELIDGTKSQLGSLFVDYRNQSEFKDENTLVYGHNMEDDSMFASIPEYKHQEYFNQHPVLYLLLPEKTYRVELIGGFDIKPEDLGLLQFNFATPRDHDAFVFQVRTRSWFRSNVETTSADRFLTLVTCNYETVEGRFVLVGRLVPLD